MRVMALTDDAVLEAAETIRSGGTVVYPTETAYALGADPLNPEAVKRVFMLKERDEHKPLGLIASSLEQVEALCEMDNVERNLAAQWPAALSLILRHKPQSGSAHEALALITAGTGTVSIRVSAHPEARRIAEILGHPIIATSANRSGSQPSFSSSDIQKQFSADPQPDLALDGGALSQSEMSTIVKVEGGRPVIVRQGAVRITSSRS